MIGKDLTIIHRQCIAITGGTVIGEYATIFHGVTIGEHGKKKDGTLHVGNRVKIFAGLKLLGAITIEDDSVIGANSVVLCSVPQNSILGIPVKVRRLNEKVVVDN